MPMPISSGIIFSGIETAIEKSPGLGDRLRPKLSVIVRLENG
jgi:hypothetical protein